MQELPGDGGAGGRGHEPPHPVPVLISHQRKSTPGDNVIPGPKRPGSLNLADGDLRGYPIQGKRTAQKKTMR